MTFTTDMRLTIEIFDLMKSRGGKMTVYKDLTLIHLPKKNEEDEQEYNLTSQMQEYLWEDGWNFAESEALEDPIPLIVSSGYNAGAGMIHCWLDKQNEWCIPMEARVEDLHFAGYMPTSTLLVPGPEDTTIHMGFKKLYLYKVDKELGIKGLVERNESSDELRQKLFHKALASFAAQPNSLLQAQITAQQAALQQASSFSQLQMGAGALGNSLGGLLGGNGKQTALDLNHFNYYPYGPSANEYIGRVSKWIKRVFTKTSGTD